MPLPMDPIQRLDNRDNEPSGAIVQKAAEWLAHFESGDASEQDYGEFDAWRSAHPAHALALDRLGGVRESLASTPDVERETLRRLLLRPQRTAGTPFLIVLALLSAGWAGSRLPTVQLFFADQKTTAGETRTVDLADGSTLTLSTDSAVNINVDSSGRRVTLLRGEILAQVAKHEGESFTVDTDDGTATALGTAFTVRKEAASTVIAVAESRVRVCPSREGDAACLTLTPGQRARLTPRQVVHLPDVAAIDVGAWAEGWLSVDDRPLVEVLDELNPWRAVPVAFDRRSLADLRVSGVFSLRDPDKAADNLTKLLPIVMDDSDPAAPVIRRR